MRPVEDKSGYLSEAPITSEVQRLFDEDLVYPGFVMNASHLWAHLPSAQQSFSTLWNDVFDRTGLAERQRAILITAATATRGDSYCALVWGERLAQATDPAFAAGVLQGTDDGLGEQDRVLARWARKVASDPNGTTAADVELLRAAGLDDDQILAVTVYIALRVAFATVNDALGAQPDAAIADRAPREVAEAVTWGRPPA